MYCKPPTTYCQREAYVTAAVQPLVDAKGAVTEEIALQVQDLLLLEGSEASRQDTLPTTQTA